MSKFEKFYFESIIFTLTATSFPSGKHPATMRMIPDRQLPAVLNIRMRSSSV